MPSSPFSLSLLALLFTLTPTTVAGTTATTATTASAATETCVSYGVDFQPGGTYFQNESSTSPFTFVSIFEGCQTAICQNLLIDPNGNEYECSNTELTPADTNQLSTCDIDKDEMFSGEWTIILNSNNGDGSPIAYEREISLIVGYPTTITYTPTFTATATITAYTNVTTTQTTDVLVHVNTTITDPAVTEAPTVTVHPTTTTTIITTLGTVSKTAHTIEPSVVSETYTAQCTVPPAQQWPDPWCTITPTLYQIPALETPRYWWPRGLSKPEGWSRDKWLQERKARLGDKKMVKRGLDSSITTVTQENTALCPTVTSTDTAATSTMLITTMETDTITSTTTYTVMEGTTSYPTDTVTAPTTTITKHAYTLITTTCTTITLTPTVTIGTTTTPAWSAAICTDKGGFMW